MEIVKEPNKVLRRKADAVSIKEIPGRKIQDLIRCMKETLAVTPDGVGLAAPQVGQPLQIFLASEEGEEIDRIERLARGGGVADESDQLKVRNGRDTAKREWKHYVFINPVILKTSKRKNERAEGCLSVPGTFGDVRRYEKVTVQAYDENGKKFIRGASKFFARILQHEYDHLQGVLFIDKAEKLFEPDVHDTSLGG